MKCTVWISNAKELDEICDEGNSLIRFTGLSWDEATPLIQAAFGQGYLCIMDNEEAEA